MKYDYKAVEAKWQKVWEDEKTFHVEIDHKKPKFYALVEFPYPCLLYTFSEPTRLRRISYAVFCLKKKKQNK